MVLGQVGKGDDGFLNDPSLIGVMIDNLMEACIQSLRALNAPIGKSSSD